MQYRPMQNGLLVSDESGTEQYFPFVPISRLNHTSMSFAEAKKAYAAFRSALGFGPARLLTPPTNNVKLAKGEGLPSWSLALAQGNTSGVNLCGWMTRECFFNCVADAGNGRYESVALGRKVRTWFLLVNPSAFAALLYGELERAASDGPVGARINCFSVLDWDVIFPGLFAIPNIVYYDYTKSPERINRKPANWHLTFSASERTTDAEILTNVMMGTNVAVVFQVGRTKPLPTNWFGSGTLADWSALISRLGLDPILITNGIPVINGDEDDRRYEDPVGCIVGLHAKGKMRNGSPMARDPNPLVILQ